VFDRRIVDKVLDFGNTGKLQNPGMVINRNLVATISQRSHRQIRDGDKIEGIAHAPRIWRNFKKRFPKDPILSPTTAFASMDTYS
jgi:hypothetical protein